MYKNFSVSHSSNIKRFVSILVLMELCIKTRNFKCLLYIYTWVSILVLMELCIKTQIYIAFHFTSNISFNPCFNGTMYKNYLKCFFRQFDIISFNPCFNGTMYKNGYARIQELVIFLVSILVLMELCIKTEQTRK